MINDSVLQFLYHTSFILFFFFGILQLILRNRLLLNYALAALFFVGGYEFLYFWAFNSGFISDFPFLLYSEIVTSYLIGPAFYFYFCLTLGFKNSIKRLDILHLVPFFLSLAGIILFRKLFPDTTIIAYGVPDYSGHLLLSLLEILSDVSVGIYILIILIKTIILFRGEKTSRELKLVLSFLVLLVLSSIILVTGGITNSLVLLAFGIGSFTVLPSLYIIFSFRYPEFSMKVLKAAKLLHSNKSILKNLDVKLLLSELDLLMTEEHLYRQDELSLQTLSGYLKISSHQLSKLLNEHAGCSFRTYINSYRVAEAKKLLQERPEMGVLEVSLLVGFNSRSSFYSAFQKETGCIPAEFRKKTCPEL